MADSLYPPSLDLTGGKPSADELKLLRKLDDLYDEGKRKRDAWAPPKDIERDLKLFRGEVGPKSGEAHFTANFIETFIERMVSRLTDTRPILRTENRKAGLRNVALVAKRVIQAIWDETDMQRNTYKMAHNAATTRSAGLYTGYDPVTDTIELEVLRLSQVVFDPRVIEAARVDRDSNYLFVDRVRPLDELRRRFPGRGGLVKPDADLSDIIPSTKTTLLSAAKELFSGKQSEKTALPCARVRECYVKDWQTGGDAQLFPFGRRVIRTKDVALWDGPNHWWDGLWPVDWFDWRVDPEHVWGMSEPSRLMRLQLSFNQLMDGLVENQLLTNFLLVMADWDSFDPATWKKLQSISSSLVLQKRTRTASQLQIQPPASFGLDKIALVRQIFTYAQFLTGETDITFGETGSLQSGQAVEGLMEPTGLLTRARASRLEDFFGRVGQKLLARIFQFWPGERVISLVGPTGPAIEYVVKRADFYVDDAGKMVDEKERQRVFRDIHFMVQPGSSAPGSRIKRGQHMRDLVLLGAATRQDVLEASDFPEPEAMVERAKKEFLELGPILKTLGGRDGR